MMMYGLVLLCLLLPVQVHAVKPGLSMYRWTEHPGATVPEGDVFRDEAGRSVAVGDLVGDAPVILALGYYHCPNLCGLARNTLLTALADTGLAAGKDYTLAVVSIDPDETSQDARAAKARDMAAYPLPGAAAGWRYLVGSRDSIAALTDAVGYQGQFDPELKQFVHPTGLVVVAPNGRITSYLLGLGFRSGDLRVALTRARLGAIDAAAAPVLLLCYHYDATTGRYSLSIMKLLRLAAGLTAVTVGIVGVLMFRREGRRP